jgi:hypothetical protein
LIPVILNKSTENACELETDRNFEINCEEKHSNADILNSPKSKSNNEYGDFNSRFSSPSKTYELQQSTAYLALKNQYNNNKHLNSS